MALTSIPIGPVLIRACPTRSGRRFGPCPACRAERTGNDRRPPVVAVGRGLGWSCYACGATGDAYDLAAWVVAGVRAREAGRRFPEVLRWLEGEDAQTADPPEPWAPRRPHGIREVLRACRRPASVPEVAAWLSQRGLDPERVRAGVLPDAFEAGWWPRGWSAIWRLVVPAYSGRGELLSMQGRAVVPDTDPKCRWPKGCDAGGLLFGDPRFLRGEPTEATRLLIVEGLTDYLAATSTLGPSTAVIGIASGSISALRLLAPRLPAIVATDYDRQGEVYATAVAEALAPHPVRRLPYRLGAAWT